MNPTFVVPLDGSAFAEQALSLAETIAGRAKATLHLVRVHVPMAGGFLAGHHALPCDAEIRACERDYLEKVAQRIRTGAGVPVTFALVEGAIADGLGREAQAVGAGLVVMTTHGRGALSRLWLGSVADRMVRQATVPLLLVRPREGGACPAAGARQPHILVPLDGSELAEQALGPALAVGRLLGARYTLLQVISPVGRLIADQAGCYVPGELAARELKRLEQALRVQAEAYLERVARDLRAGSASMQTRVVTHEDPAAAIGEFAGANAVDGIALATHGRGGFARLFLGSVADKVLRTASVPLLVWRPLVESRNGQPAERPPAEPASRMPTSGAG
jgi:nucleotide-binding universal stress UspA family protein